MDFYLWWLIAMYMTLGAHEFAESHDQIMGPHKSREHVFFLLLYMILWGPADIVARYKIYRERGAGK